MRGHRDHRTVHGGDHDLPQSPLLRTERIDVDVRAFLDDVGTVFRVFDRQDSGCVSYGVQGGRGGRWFVKTAAQPRAVAYLENAAAFHRAVRHPMIPSLVNTIATPAGPALVYEWVDGEVLGSPEFAGAKGRSRPESPYYRFRRLPLPRIMDVLNAVFDLHAHIEDEGYVAVDFYDGCIIYDFQRHQVHCCDFDHYHRGPFVLEDERLPGSSRFMAPEELQQGSLIDHRTNVYTMGAAAFVFLSDSERQQHAWEGPRALWEVATRAASRERARRYVSVGEFYREWMSGAVHIP